MAISHQAFNLISRDGTVLQGRYWKPRGNPIATLCIIHGIGEHSMRYDAWARQFCKKKYMVYALDYRGHGLSEGKRGHIDQLNDLMNDIGALVRRSKRNFGNIPCFIYGHSMGGNLVLNYLMIRRQDFAGAIISAPWINLVKPPSKLLKKISAWLNPIYPEMIFRTRIKSSQLTSIRDKKENADKDPLMHSKISVRLYNEIDRYTHEILKWETPIRIPLLFLHGASDPITSPSGSELIAAKNPEIFTCLKYENTLHEIHNEPIANQVFVDMVEWMSKQIVHEAPTSSIDT